MERPIDTGVEMGVAPILTQHVAETLHDLLAEIQGRSAGTQPLVHERLHHGVQPDRRDEQARAVEQETARQGRAVRVRLRSAAFHTTEILALLHAGAEGESGQATEFGQEFVRIAVDATLKGQTRQVQADREKYGRMLPVDSFGEGNRLTLAIEDETHRCAVEREPCQTV